MTTRLDESAIMRPILLTALILASGIALAESASIIASPEKGDADTVALLNNVPIDWSEIRDTLAETAGAQILEECILDRLLKERIDATGQRVDESDAAAERQMLLASLDADPDRAARMLSALRDTRLLGDRRFGMLMKRNAMLRALVAPQIEVTDEQISAAHRVEHGPRYQVRIITSSSAAEIDIIIAQLSAGADFVTLAVERSTDASAARGGLLEPISPDDDRYPFALRSVLADLSPGTLSPIIQLDDSFAVAQLVRAIAADDLTIEQTRASLIQSLRRSQERIRMDALAAELLSEAQIRVLEPALADSWKRLRGSR